jgi:outer membrane protein assembly factor BamB
MRGRAWSEPIPIIRVPPTHHEISSRFRLPSQRVAEDAQRLLSYHPLVTRLSSADDSSLDHELVMFHDRDRIYAFNLQTGKPAWERSGPDARAGQVYPRGRVGEPSAQTNYAQVLGVPRFTATIHDTYLFIRLGSQITGWSDANISDRRGALVVLDLAQQGKLIAEIKPENERWSFEGPPVCQGSRFFVAMRYNDVRPQSHVACYELVAITGTSGTAYEPRLRWRRMVVAAESPARASADEITQGLLTLAEGTLYFNTNLGAIASLSVQDGHIRWLTTYPRAKRSDNNAHLFRDLNPCVYYRGTLYAAPTDSPQIFALDAMTGLVRWASSPALSDVVHLLGVAQGSLIASGKQLWWLDAESGKTVIRFPDSNESLGFGRGLLTGDVVLWPTREELYVFLQNQSPASDANAKPQMPRDPIRLKDYSDRIVGGNLVAAGDYLLLATSDYIWAFGPKLKDNQMTKAE